MQLTQFLSLEPKAQISASTMLSVDAHQSLSADVEKRLVSANHSLSFLMNASPKKKSSPDHIAKIRAKKEEVAQLKNAAESLSSNQPAEQSGRQMDPELQEGLIFLDSFKPTNKHIHENMIADASAEALHQLVKAMDFKETLTIVKIATFENSVNDKEKAVGQKKYLKWLKHFRKKVEFQQGLQSVHVIPASSMRSQGQHSAVYEALGQTHVERPAYVIEEPPMAIEFTKENVNGGQDVEMSADEAAMPIQCVRDAEGAVNKTEAAEEFSSDESSIAYDFDELRQQFDNAHFQSMKKMIRTVFGETLYQQIWYQSKSQVLQENPTLALVAEPVE